MPSPGCAWSHQTPQLTGISGCGLPLHKCFQYVDNALQLILQGEPIKHLDESAHKIKCSRLDRVLQQWRNVCPHQPWKPAQGPIKLQAPCSTVRFWARQRKRTFQAHSASMTIPLHMPLHVLQSTRASMPNACLFWLQVPAAQCKCVSKLRLPCH